MPKNRKKRRRDSTGAAEAGEAKAAQPFNYRLALLMLAIFLVVTVLYYYLLSLYIWWASPVLYTATAVLFFTIFFLNRGFSRTPIDRSMLNPHWTEARKDAFLADDIRRKALARKLMVPLVPLMLLVAVDILILVILPLFSDSSI